MDQGSRFANVPSSPSLRLFSGAKLVPVDSTATARPQHPAHRPGAAQSALPALTRRRNTFGEKPDAPDASSSAHLSSVQPLAIPLDDNPR
ncbi:uncharacterized protein CTHT_0053090 [Thermochaetoides thermophila DSM 1495]|uniref:Uncharacterized protein n=1 Tax=Chaetomium thermophilum (strain DSM 1495 / CBS 144.50 / IMI 039719) TaxID=759272 RepID=G0SDV1_CHATD|nr:hypothetical protein CTHT_0053090 [Thermochaetoides thermophila DSM 1495]EGS18702.1 hypothetical protein CTHT_0053090 [Thermochaetoides thermophila DSM 1495]